MDYWAETMRYEVWKIAHEGWRAVIDPSTESVHLPLCKRGIEEDLSNKISPNPSFPKRGTEFLPSASSGQVAKPNTNLIPAQQIVARYFSAERQAIEQLKALRDAISGQMEEMDEKHGGEDGLLAEGKTDKGKLERAGLFNPS